MLTPLIGMTLEQLRDVAAGVGLRPFAAGQMARWLYLKRAVSIDQMTDLPLTARQKLKENFTVGREEPLARVVSVDGTVKYLFAGAGSRDVETVMIPDADRATLCVSSQAGCRMNCSFCMTGRQGFHGQLPAARIINQVLSVTESEKLTNIVFMGMGEPMDNLPEVLKAIEILTAPWGLAWSPKRITVSSIGKISELRTLIETTKVHVAVSLHSPFSDERLRLMPVEKAYPAADVIAMLCGYDWAHQRRLSFEYIMWDRLNELGITATIRASRGEDIMAACGLLAGSRAETKPNPTEK